MELITYQNVEKFVEENMDLILEKEWFNCLMVGNCLEGLKEGAENWLLAKVVNNTKTELIMLCRRPWKLLLYSPTNNVSEELLNFTAKELYKIDPNLPGVNTEQRMANKFAKLYCEEANLQYKIEKPLRILLLEKTEDKKLDESVTFRKANMADKEELVNFIKEFQEEALNEEFSKEKAEEKFKTYMEKGYYVLEKEGKILSQAVLLRNMKKGKCVSGVYTAKDERGKGYAYNLVYRLSKKVLDDGAEYCVLYTDDENPISNHVYEKIGYKKMVDCEDIAFYKEESACL